MNFGGEPENNTAPGFQIDESDHITFISPEKAKKLAEWYLCNKKIFISLPYESTCSFNLLSNIVQTTNIPLAVLNKNEQLLEYFSIRPSHTIDEKFLTPLLNVISQKKSVYSYLTTLNDSALKNRIEKLLQDMDCCLICFDKTIEVISTCGHGYCHTCCNQIKNCSMCGTSIVKFDINMSEKKEKTKYQLITLPGQFVKDRFNSIMMRTTRLDHLLQEELIRFVEIGYTPKKVSPSEETTSFYLSLLYINKMHLNWISKQLNTPLRLKRFLSLLSGGDIKEKLTQKMTNHLRMLCARSITNWNENKMINDQLSQHIGFWQWFFRICHFGSKKYQKYNIQKWQQVIYDAKLPMASVGELEKYLQTRNEQVYQLLEKNPNLMHRNMIAILNVFPDVAKLPIHKMKLEHLYRLHYYLQSERPKHIYRERHGQTWSNSKERTYPSKEIRGNMISRIENEVANRKDPRHLIIRLPTDRIERVINGKSCKAPSWASNVMTIGDAFTFSPDKQMLLFIYWENGKQRIDLDLSVILLDENDNQVGYIDYTRLELDNIRHSGDIVDAPHGASEYITFTPQNVSAKKALVICYSYNDIAYDEMGSAMVGIGIIEAGGLGPGGSRVLAACHLKGKSRVNLTAEIHFTDRTVTFLNTNCNKKMARYSVYGSSQAVITYYQDTMSWLAMSAPPDFASFASLAATQFHLSDEVREEPVIWIGNNPPPLPVGSTIVSKELITQEGVTQTSDPYSILT
jgi:hypothetical protein